MTANLPDDVKKSLSISDLNEMPVEEIAYIKRIEASRGIGYGVYATDGRELAVFPTRDIAIHTARQNDFAPVSAH